MSAYRTAWRADSLLRLCRPLLRRLGRALATKSGTSEELQVGQGVCVESTVFAAINHQGLLIRGDGHAVRDPAEGVLLRRGDVGKVDEIGLHMRVKINNRKTVTRVLRVHLVGRAVGFLRYRHRLGGGTTFQIPPN